MVQLSLLTGNQSRILAQFVKPGSKSVILNLYGIVIMNLGTGYLVYMQPSAPENLRKGNSQRQSVGKGKFVLTIGVVLRT